MAKVNTPANKGAGPASAVNVTYDNTTSELSATNVQAAIDEVDSNLDTLSGTVSELIDDQATSATKVWSSNKTNTELGTKLSQTTYAETGAVNLRNQDVNTKTQYGITFTVSSDKIITVSGINDNTNPSSMILHKQTGFSKPLKVYGVPSNANNNYCCIEVYDNTSNRRIGFVTGSNPEVIIPASDHWVQVTLYVWKNQDISTPMEFPVMITPLSYTGPYAPPAKTNAELTGDVTAIEEAFTANTSIVSSSSALKLYRVGKLLTFNGYIITNNGVGSQNDTILTLTNARSVSGVVTYVQLLNSSGNLYLAKLNSNGTITLDSASLPKAGYSVIGTVLIS